MLRIISVDDDENVRKSLDTLIKNYTQKNNLQCSSVFYDNAVDFLANYKLDADVIFLDIKMPNMSGMEAAQKIREVDSLVIIVFITDMVQFAVDGYSVGALDFVLKPLKADIFYTLMDKISKRIEDSETKGIVIKNNGVLKLLSVSEITYIEVTGHKLIFHTAKSEFYDWGTLDKIQKKLPEKSFARCNVAFLIGLAHIETIEGDDVMIGNERLKISRKKKKEFFEKVAKYFGEMIYH